MAKTYGILLTCDHTRWFKKPLPEPGDFIFCPSCNSDEQAMPVDVACFGEIIDVAGEFTSRRELDKGYAGTCLYDGCTETDRSWSWQSLREKMHTHYMREHTRFGSALVIEQGERLPKDAPAPF